MIDYVPYIAVGLICTLGVLLVIDSTYALFGKECNIYEYFFKVIGSPILLIFFITRIRYISKDDLYLSKKELSRNTEEKNLTYIKYKKGIKYIKTYDRDDYISLHYYFIPSLGLYTKKGFDSVYIGNKEEMVKSFNIKEQIKSMTGINKFNL